MSTSPLVSVLIPTFNRVTELGELLDALQDQVYLNFEVVIVDGGSRDSAGLDLLVEKHQIKFIQANQASLGLQRNLAIEHSSGDLVGFIDDDAIPQNTDWIQKFVDAFELDKNMAAAGGEVRNYYHKDVVEYSGGLTSAYGFQKFRSQQKLSSQVNDPDLYLRVPGGNSFFRRSALMEINGFDLTYLYYQDETDVCVRLIKAGYEVAYIDDAGIWHKKKPQDSHSGYRNWNNIITSDTYFALKHGRDIWPVRAIKTIYFSVKKHYWVDMRVNVLQKKISLGEFSGFIWSWLRGVINGFWAYVSKNLEPIVPLENKSAVFKGFRP